MLFPPGVAMCAIAAGIGAALKERRKISRPLRMPDVLICAAALLAVVELASLGEAAAGAMAEQAASAAKTRRLISKIRLSSAEVRRKHRLRRKVRRLRALLLQRESQGGWYARTDWWPVHS